MSDVVYCGPVRFSKFFYRNLFSDDLTECSEEYFDICVIAHRSLYEMRYNTPNVQDFYLDGKLTARRVRGI